MAISILLIIAFQAYWVRKLFNEEKSAVLKSADVVFRESIYRLQAQRFTSDTMVFKGMPGDNLFMGDIVEAVNTVKNTGKDSAGKFMISVDAETDGRMHAAQQFRRDAFAFEPFADGGGAAAAANHSDIARGLVNHSVQTDLVVTVPARDDDDVRGGRDAQRLQRRDKIIGDQMNLFVRKLVASGEVRAVVNHCDVKIQQPSGFGNSLANVATATNNQFQWRTRNL